MKLRREKLVLNVKEINGNFQIKIKGLKEKGIFLDSFITYFGQMAAQTSLSSCCFQYPLMEQTSTTH